MFTVTAIIKIVVTFILNNRNLSLEKDGSLRVADDSYALGLFKNNDSTPGGQDPYGNVQSPHQPRRLALTSDANWQYPDRCQQITLYFCGLMPMVSGCSGGCARYQSLYAGNETALAGITTADISTITRADGKQTVYKDGLYIISLEMQIARCKWRWLRRNLVCYNRLLSDVREQPAVGVDGKNYTADEKKVQGLANT
ncbi:hypothetical protein CS542_02415 [Pedobacter sp. IW39]|nr:hypothetical protein CS542_02415 [Pedobacter sp. IW39]